MIEAAFEAIPADEFHVRKAKVVRLDSETILVEQACLCRFLA